MAHLEVTQDWWRPAYKRPSTTTLMPAVAVDGSRVAFYALVAFTTILLLSPQAWLPVLKPLRIALLAAGFAFAAHISERTVHRQTVTPASAEIGIVLGLVAWAIITVPLSSWPGGSVRLLTDTYLKAVAFFWLIGSIINTRNRLSVMAWTLVLCSVPLAATGVWNYVGGTVYTTGVSGFYRVAGYGGNEGSGIAANPNDLALVLNLIIPIAGAVALSSRGIRKWAATAAMLLGIAAVIVTFSRAGFLTLATVVIMLIAVIARRKSPAAAAALLLLALCVPPLLPAGYVDRLSTITNIEEDKTGSAQGRWTDFQVAGKLVLKNPLIGVGIGQDILALNQARGREEWISVHNAYLQYAVDLGIPGALLFIILHVLCYRSASRVERRAMQEPGMRDIAFLAAGVQISLVAFAVAAMFHPIAYQFYFFAIGGLAVALKNTCRTTVRLAQPVRSAS